MTRPIRLFIELFFTALFIILIAAGGLLWQINSRTIHIDQFIPDVQDILLDIAPDFSFQINHAVLSSGKQNHAFQIILQDVTVSNAAKEKIGSVESMALGFSWRNLLLLQTIPSTILITKPSVQLVRFEDGHIGFNTNTDKKIKPKQGYGFNHFAQVFLKTRDAFREVRIEDAWVQFEDHKDPMKMQARKGDLILRRDKNKVTGSLSLDFIADDFKQNLTGKVTYNPNLQTTTFTLGMRDVAMTELSKLLPQIPKDMTISTPLTAVGTITLDRLFKPLNLELDIKADQGTLTYAPYYPQPIALDQLILRSDYNLLDESLTLKELTIDIGDAQIKAQGRIADLGNAEKKNKAISLIGQITKMPIDALPLYWPHELANDARTWVTSNISKGIADKATLNLSGNLNSENKLHIEHLSGVIDFSKAQVDYLRPLPPVTELVGQAIYDLDHFNIAMYSGRVLDSNLDKGDVRISGFQDPAQRIDMLFDLSGQLRDALNVIASKPLEYPQKMNMLPEQFTGEIDTKLYLGFPLLHSLTFKDVDMKAGALLKNVTINNVVRDLDVTSDQLALHVDTSGLLVKGNARVADAKTTLQWQEFFVPVNNAASQVTLDGAFTPKMLDDLKLSLGTAFQGKANGTIRVIQGVDKNIAVTLNADATQAIFNVPTIGLNKLAGQTSSIQMDAAIDKDGTSTLSNVSFKAPEISIQNAMARWDKNKNLQSATLKDIAIGRTKASLIVAPKGNTVMHIVLRGSVLDLSPYWTKKKSDQTPESTDPVRYDISLRGDKVFLDPDVPFTGLNADVSIQKDKIKTMSINGKVEDATLSAKQTRSADNIATLTATSTNTGKILQALDITDTVRGGTLNVQGASTVEKPDVIIANISMDRFTIVKAPVLARLLNALSPVGLLQLLNNEGLAFDTLKTQAYLLDKNVIQLREGRLAGASLGMSFRGKLYRQDDSMNINGTLVPLEGINKIASKIPVLGQILTGLKGEGFLAATYKIKGNSNDPQVSVNPLSALAPGILRSIFFEDSKDE
jgi:hypothetical protein